MNERKCAEVLKTEWSVQHSPLDFFFFNEGTLEVSLFQIDPREAKLPKPCKGFATQIKSLP